MNIVKIICLLLLTFSGFQNVNAQNDKTKTKASAVTQPQKIKAPKLKTSLGFFSDSVVISIEQAKAILGSSLKVTDDKNNLLNITYYQFLYKRKAMKEDEQTGKLSPTTSIVSDYFTSTPLPIKWIKIINEDLVAGEELYFFDVIAKDSQGRPFYSSNLKIIIK